MLIERENEKAKAPEERHVKVECKPISGHQTIPHLILPFEHRKLFIGTKKEPPFWMALQF
jgi:hypothetical protein